jgi:hypothetical protein
VMRMAIKAAAKIFSRLNRLNEERMRIPNEVNQVPTP